MKKSLLLFGLAASMGLAAQTQVTADQSGIQLQSAINAAQAGTTVYVQAGTYYGNFTMKEGVNVSGGWNETFTEQTDYASVLDANADGRVLEQPSDFSTWTIWSNFTIQNGNLKTISNTPKSGLSSGVALGKKGRVQHCLIQNNTFSYNGNCMGGGVGNDAIDAATDVCAEDCIIRNNCGTHGGGVRVRGTVLNCVIENNNTNNSIKVGPGGGVHLQTGRLVGCIVRGNLSGENTGGVRCYGKCQVINCLIAGNTATGKIGGINIESVNSDIIGCTIVDNGQASGTASQCGLSCTATAEDNGTKLANNIIWGNKHNGVVQEAQIYYVSHYNETNRSHNAATNQLAGKTGSIRLSMSNTEDGTCIDGDSNERPTYAPHFADPANGDYRLTWQSPVLNKGLDELTTLSKDLDGNDRIVLTVDMGAYELPFYTLTVLPFEHATLVVDGVPVGADDYALPFGYTAQATIGTEEGYEVASVSFNGSEMAATDGAYTIPALTEDAVIAITVQEKESTALDKSVHPVQTVKCIRNGQVLIIRNGEKYTVQGQIAE